jgi:hypothetical protein
MTDPVFGKPDAEGWYEWKGDDMVRPAGMVEVVTRDGSVTVRSAQLLSWKFWAFCSGSDIVKWKPHAEEEDRYEGYAASEFLSGSFE